MSNLKMTISIELADNYVGNTDKLLECLMFMRVLCEKYPGQVEPAFEALRQEYREAPIVERGDLTKRKGNIDE